MIEFKKKKISIKNKYIFDFEVFATNINIILVLFEKEEIWELKRKLNEWMNEWNREKLLNKIKESKQNQIQIKYNL